MNDDLTTTDSADIELVGLLTAPDRTAFYAELAAAGPVSRGRYFNGRPVWLVTGYDESLAVLKDHRRFSNDIIGRRSTIDMAAIGGLPEDVQPYLMHTLGAYDPPGHSRLRKLVSRGFTMSRVEAMRPDPGNRRRVARRLDRRTGGRCRGDTGLSVADPGHL